MTTDTPRPRSNAISPVVTMGSGGPDTAPEEVQRFFASEFSADMIPAPRGDYVRYEDYAALSAKLEAERAKPPSYRFTAANLIGSVALGFDCIQRSDVREAFLFHGGKAVIAGSYISFNGVAIMPVPYWEAEKARAEAAEARAEAAEAELAEAVGVIKFCARLNVTVIEKGERARAYLDRHQKETGV